ncbi:MAG TPA: DsrE family protein [Frankiaceae bacterium]|jgi:predicted peroxiredoxin|nr:DsrE family protein [Frankiaceae bacterium]
MTTATAAPDSKVLICLNHGAEDPESVLIAYLVGVESLRAGKQAVMFLTKDAVHVATPGFAETIVIAGAPSVSELHKEYLAKGGRLIACPVCVRVRGMQDAEWVAGAEVAGVPSILEYTTGGALVFNY